MNEVLIITVFSAQLAKNEAINFLQNADLTGKSGKLKKWKIIN